MDALNWLKQYGLSHITFVIKSNDMPSLIGMMDEYGNYREALNKSSDISNIISESDKPLKSLHLDEYEDTYRKTFSMQQKPEIREELYHRLIINLTKSWDWAKVWDHFELKGEFIYNKYEEDGYRYFLCEIQGDIGILITKDNSSNFCKIYSMTESDVFDTPFENKIKKAVSSYISKNKYQFNV